MPGPDTALLFAAGFGTRMAPLTDNRPKPLIEVAGRPLFDHALDLVRAAAIPRLVANTHYLAPMLSAHLASRGVIESHEPEILDTGGGLKQVASRTGGAAIITLNTDAVWTGANPLGPACKAWDPDRMDALLVIVPRHNALGHRGKGDFVSDPDGRLSPGPGDIYSGLQIIKTQPFLDEQDHAFRMYRIWQRMLDAGRLYGLTHSGGWCDVGRPESVALAEAMLGHLHV